MNVAQALFASNDTKILTKSLLVPADKTPVNFSSVVSLASVVMIPTGVTVANECGGPTLVHCVEPPENADIGQQ